MTLQIRGDWMEHGFHDALAPRYVLIDILSDGSMFDDQAGCIVSMDADGELRGWPCHTFVPDACEIERLRRALSR